MQASQVVMLTLLDGEVNTSKPAAYFSIRKNIVNLSSFLRFAATIWFSLLLFETIIAEYAVVISS